MIICCNKPRIDGYVLTETEDNIQRSTINNLGLLCYELAYLENPFKTRGISNADIKQEANN